MLEKSDELNNSEKFYGEVDFSNLDELIFSQNQIGNASFSLFSNIPPIPKLKNNNIHYLCSKCINFPFIEFIDEKRILYTCGCVKKKLILVKDIFKPEKNYMTFLNNNILSQNDFNSNNKNSYNKDFQNIEFYCFKHKSFKLHKFRYYCIECHENLCKECCQNHLGVQHNLIVFDYNNSETYIKLEKINEIINSSLVIDENIDKDNLNDFFDENYEKPKENDIKCIKFNNNFEKEESEKNNLNNLFELIYVIIADYLRYPNYTHFFNIENIYNFLKYKYGAKIKQDKNIINNKELTKLEYDFSNTIKDNFNEEILLKLVIERMNEIEEKIKKTKSCQNWELKQI